MVASRASRVTAGSARRWLVCRSDLSCSCSITVALVGPLFAVFYILVIRYDGIYELLKGPQRRWQPGALDWGVHAEHSLLVIAIHWTVAAQ